MAERFLTAGWFEVIEDIEPDPLLATELGPGEAAVIAHAYRTGAQLVLLDERKARRIATRAYQLRVKGTAGLLVLAKRQGLLPAVRPLLESMTDRGYYLSRRLIDEATGAAGERVEAPGPR